jgi:acetyl coenzyme A synthetase (ADP forming)-like protein
LSGPNGKSREEIHRIFYPRSVAVVGTNRVKGTVPYDIFANILRDGFQGIVYPVSPRERAVAGVRAYKYVLDIEDEVDMAVVVFPASVIHLAMEQVGQKGIKSAIVISAGFREIGEAGLAREQQLQQIAAKYGITFVGPNCLGVINTDPEISFNASFARQMPAQGSIAFLSQSGALCTAVLDYARARQIGFSKFVSFGNKADVTEIDLLLYLKDDPATRVILLYLEEITDGRGLMEAAREVIEGSGKPVLVLKSGRTSEGASAAASHTGSLAGSDQVCQAALRQAGIIRCDTVEDLFNYAIALAYQPVPAGRRVAIVTNAGGPGVLATDSAVQEELELARFEERTVGVLRKSLPHTANFKNPVDIIGDAKKDRYSAALSSVLADANVDGALVILTPQSMTDIRPIAEEICAIASRQQKPVYASFMGEADVREGVEVLQRRRIPHYALPEDMCRAFARAWLFGLIRERPRRVAESLGGVDPGAARQALAAAAGQGRKALSSAEAFGLLQAYGLPVLPFREATRARDAAARAGEIGFPVVLKVLAEGVSHKTEVGGVLLGLRDSREVEEGFKTLQARLEEARPGARMRGVLVQKMGQGAEELILGLRGDPSFGPVVMAGFGGIFVELLRDVRFRVAPVGSDEARGMLEELELYPLLAGVRGRPPRDLGGVLECVQRLSLLGLEHPEIAELDVNPLLVWDEGRGCAAADARVFLK